MYNFYTYDFENNFVIIFASSGKNFAKITSGFMCTPHFIRGYYTSTPFGVVYDK